MGAVKLISPYMDINECAEYLKVSRATIYKWSCYNQIPTNRVGRHLRFRRDLIDAWTSQKQKPDKSAPSQTRFQSARERLRSLKTELTKNSDSMNE